MVMYGMSTVRKMGVVMILMHCDSSVRVFYNFSPRTKRPERSGAVPLQPIFLIGRFCACVARASGVERGV